MATLPQRVLRNNSGEILRKAERGARFVITVDGRPVAELGPLPRASWVPRERVIQLLAETPSDPSLAKDLAASGARVGAHDPWAPRPRKR